MLPLVVVVVVVMKNVQFTLFLILFRTFKFIHAAVSGKYSHS